MRRLLIVLDGVSTLTILTYMYLLEIGVYFILFYYLLIYYFFILILRFVCL